MQISGMTITHAFFSARERNVIDVMRPDGRTLCFGHDLEQVRSRYPDAVILTWDEACTATDRAARAHYCRGPSPSTEKDFWYALEQLPPAKWTRGDYSESFHVSERITGDLVDWWLRVGERYYHLVDSASRTHAELLGMVGA